MSDQSEAQQLQRDILLLSLNVAVPLRIAELMKRPPAGRWSEAKRWAELGADAVASQGDQLMYRTKARKGEGGTAETFNALARGLAALALQPGGVRYLGMHWCVEHPLGTSTPDVTCTASGHPQPRPVDVAEIPDG